ncbi:MAG: transcriptional regulator [Deltaproteobacteria bacterium]|nr:transcriptional regulator [Deltaproteobacteria bacterium]
MATKPVFAKRDIDEYLEVFGPEGNLSRVPLLARLRRLGLVVMVRRGLFLSVPVGEKPDSFQVDHFGVAGMLTPDAVLSYRSALEFHGLAGPGQQPAELTYSAVRPLTQFSFRGLAYRGVKFPKSLVRKGQHHLMVSPIEFNQAVLRVTSPERTLVDIIDRPDLVGGWPSAMDLLSNLSGLDIDAVVNYAKALGNSTTAAKVGYYLDGRAKGLSVKRQHLSALSALKPNQPHYLDRSRRRDGRLVSEWNLMVSR